MFKANATRGNPWEYLSHNLRLIIEELNEHNPDDIAYVYSGYAPISCRYVLISFFFHFFDRAFVAFYLVP